MSLTCSVNKCSNGGYRLNKWKRQLCGSCGCLHKENSCKCEPPFRLFTFPSKLRKSELREKWKQVVGRRQGCKLWSPAKDCRICSRHFVEGEPTMQNPLPSLHMGYDGAEKRVKRMSQFEATKHLKKVRTIKLKSPQGIPDSVPEEELLVEDPEVETLSKPLRTVHWFLVLMAFVIGLISKIRDQNKQIAKLTAEIYSQRQTINKLRNTVYTSKILKTDDDVNFYTGLVNKALFLKLHGFLAPYVNRRWTGVVSMVKNVRNFRSNPRFGPSRKLCSQSEFLLMLMKLRLGLANKDLAKRFDLSESLCSRIFFSWLRSASTVFKSLVFMPDEEELIASKPERFRKFADLHSIIDCTELFIETPKDLFLQSATWSDYKHHNTLKLLVVCAPNSTIIYVSPVYLGRISDKALTLDCGFLDLVPLNKMVMADKGFNIGNECADRNISLYVPPGKRGNSQMTTVNVSKTKRIANHRILIEQVIRRLKTYKILANEIPISLAPHVDEIVGVCSGLCNLKQPIYKT